MKRGKIGSQKGNPKYGLIWHGWALRRAQIMTQLQEGQLIHQKTKERKNKEDKRENKGQKKKNMGLTNLDIVY